MLSSIASFLPSLHLNSSSSASNLNPTTPPAFNPTDNPDEEEAYQQPVEEDASAKKNLTKTKNASETFIFVRPPPAKSNHPLNLQVQLVPPAARNQRQSLDDADTPISLTRTASNRSDTSSYGSTASFSSTASTSSGRRTIIPLYNLQAHNVMTNTIVDAGTDAKIARFQRRGIELIDLAILEPVEVWGEKPRGIKASRPVTPDPSSTTAGSSSASLSSTSHAQPTPTVHQPMQLQQIQPSPAPSKRNLFGKMFKKNKDGTPPVSPAPSPSNSIFSANATPTQNSLNPMAAPVTTPTQSRTHVRNLSATLSPTTISGKLRNRSSSPNPQLVGLGLRVPMQHDEANASNTDLSIAGSTAEEKILRPPVLGIQPTLSYSYTPSATAGPPAPVPAASLARTARALMYVWFVRKWLKRRAEDEGGGLFGAMRATARGSALIGAVQPAPGPVEEGVEVRFEWKRAGVKGKGKKDREGERRGRRSTGDAPEPGGRRDISNRLSVISHQSFSTNVSVSEDGHGHSPLRKERGVPPRSGTPIRDREQRGSQGEGDREPVDLDDGEDSDPEDSETPWVCTLKIRRAGATGSTPSGSTRSRRQATGNGKGNGDWQGQGTGGDDELGVLPSGPQVVRIKVGTLSPTPHHPKVVAMLKVPFPLPDVEVERMGVVRRPMGPPNARPPSQWPGTTLTAEEIKDVVCSTGMWLVVREGFGGVGKVSRKGDGWRLRA